MLLDWGRKHQERLFKSIQRSPPTHTHKQGEHANRNGQERDANPLPSGCEDPLHTPMSVCVFSPDTALSSTRWTHACWGWLEALNWPEVWVWDWVVSEACNEVENLISTSLQASLTILHDVWCLDSNSAQIQKLNRISGVFLLSFLRFLLLPCCIHEFSPFMSHFSFFAGRTCGSEVTGSSEVWCDHSASPWSTIWGWACRSGPSWPSSVTLWWVSSSWSSSSSSTRPARCPHGRRRCRAM